jgi:hypothetical protein
MGAKEEPGVLALLTALACALYLLTWFIEGPPGRRELPVTVPVPSVSPAPIPLVRASD